MAGNYQKRDLRGVDSTRRAEDMGRHRTVKYDWSPTGTLFHNCMKPVKGVRGPFAGGKTTICVWDLRYAAERVEPDELGVRRSKFLVARSTFAQLRRTTIPSWLEWFPDTVITWGSPTIGRLKQPSMRGDGTTVDMTLVFQGIKINESLEAIKGLEITGAWLNEASDIREDALDVVRGRCGRFPRKTDLVSTNNTGVIMDTNSPGETNWWFRLAEIEKPDDMAFFAQPPAVLKREKDGRVWYEPNDGRDPLIPAAENVEHLSEGYEYWMKLTRGASPNYIKRYLMNEYTSEVQGTPVYHEYVDAVHYVAEKREPKWGLPLFLGTDYGRTPCSVILQVLPNSQIVVYGELCTRDCSVDEYVERWLRPWLVNEFHFSQGANIVSFGDPAGANKEQGISMSVIQIMTQKGVPTKPCPVPRNAFMLRRDAVGDSLRRRITEGVPGLIITKPCVNLRNGFLGDYHYRVMKNADGSERTASEPDKSRDDPASHVHDALQYAVYGALHPNGEAPYDQSVRDVGKLYLPNSMRNSFTATTMDLAGFF